MEEKNYSDYTFYWYKQAELSADDFIRLEQVALIENDKMKYKIFLGYRPDNLPPYFIGLN